MRHIHGDRSSDQCLPIDDSVRHLLMPETQMTPEEQAELGRAIKGHPTAKRPLGIIEFGTHADPITVDDQEFCDGRNSASREIRKLIELLNRDHRRHQSIRPGDNVTQNDRLTVD